MRASHSCHFLRGKPPWYFFQLCLLGSIEPFKKYWWSGLQNQAEKTLATFSLIHL